MDLIAWNISFINFTICIVVCSTRQCKSVVQQVVKVIWQEGHIAEAHRWFNHIRQVAPICTPDLRHASVGPPKSIPQMASRSVLLFLHSSRQAVPTLCNGPPLFPSKLPLCIGGFGPPSNTSFIGPNQVHNPHGISIGSAAFAKHTIMTDRQTDRQTTLHRL